MSKCGAIKKSDDLPCENKGKEQYGGRCGTHKNYDEMLLQKKVVSPKVVNVTPKVKVPGGTKLILLPEKHYPKLATEDIKYENYKDLVDTIKSVKKKIHPDILISVQAMNFIAKILNNLLFLNDGSETLEQLVEFIEENIPDYYLAKRIVDDLLILKATHPLSTIKSLKISIAEYLASEIIELSCNRVRDRSFEKVAIINYYDVCNIISHDEGFITMFREFLLNLNDFHYIIGLYDPFYKRKAIPFTKFSLILSEYKIKLNKETAHFFYYYLSRKFLKSENLKLFNTPTMSEYCRFWLNNMIELLDGVQDFKSLSDSLKRDDLDERSIKFVIFLINKNVTPELANIVIKYIYA
jgi:hypothetical protein